MSETIKRKYFMGGILTLLVGLAAIGWVVWQYSSAWISRQWPTTTGVVTMSKTHLAHGVSKWGPTLMAWIVYRYTVNGQEYLGERIGYGIERNPLELVSRYPEGGSVVVYYDPARPSDAVLDPESVRGTISVLIFGGIAFFLALVMYVCYRTNGESTFFCGRNKQR